MAAASIKVSEPPLVLYALRRADDALISGHRLSEWCGHAPILEEDMALANMGLDLLGQARELYSYAANVEAKGNDEDKFAYLRDVRQYRNLLLLEQPNGDFARTMVRQFFYAAFADLYWRAMMKSNDATLAAIAPKSEKEMDYHLRHSSEWMVRLRDRPERAPTPPRTAHAGRHGAATREIYSGGREMNITAHKIKWPRGREVFSNTKIPPALSPPWTPDGMGEADGRNPRENAIRPPQAASSRRALFGVQQV